MQPTFYHVVEPYRADPAMIGIPMPECVRGPNLCFLNFANGGGTKKNEDPASPTYIDVASTTAQTTDTFYEREETLDGAIQKSDLYSVAGIFNRIRENRKK